MRGICLYELRRARRFERVGGRRGGGAGGVVEADGAVGTAGQNVGGGRGGVG